MMHISGTAKAKAILYDDQGNCTVTTERIVEPMTLQIAEDGEQEAVITYAYDVKLSNNDHSDTTSGKDDSSYATAYLTIHYKTKDTPTVYLLNKVSGRWVDPDPNDGTKISDTGEVFAVCRGIGDRLWKDQSTTKNVKNNFSFNTGFSEYMHEDDYGAIGAMLTLEISQGSQWHWPLELKNYVFPHI